MRHIDGLQRFGQRADLVHFNQHGIRNTLLDAIRQTGRVGHKKVIANKLNLVTDQIRQHFPTGPVVLIHTVLNRDDWVVCTKVCQILRIFLGCQGFTFALQLVFAVLEILRGRAVQRQIDVFAQLIAGFLNRNLDEIQSSARAFDVWRKTAFITDPSVVARSRQFFFQRVKDFGAHADGFFHVAGGHRHDHEFLNVDWVICVLAAIDDIHHWHRQDTGRGATNVAEQRLRGEISSCLCAGQRHTKNSVRAQTCFVWGAVQLDHCGIDGNLFSDIHAHEVFRDLAVYSGAGFENTFAKITRFVAVTLFHRFVSAS